MSSLLGSSTPARAATAPLDRAFDAPSGARPRQVALLVGPAGPAHERQLVGLLRSCDRQAWSPQVIAVGGRGDWAGALADRKVPLVLLHGSRRAQARQLRQSCRRSGVQVLVSLSSCTNALSLALLGLGVRRVGRAPGGHDDGALPAARQRLWSRLGRTGLDLLLADGEEADGWRLQAGARQQVLYLQDTVEAVTDDHCPHAVHQPLWDLLGDVADVPSQRGTRALDLLLSLLLAPLVAAVTALLALAVLVLDGRPVLYRGPRVGRYGTGFEVLKLRTMRSGPGTGVTGADDPRVTRLGRLLRRSKLDELPQLLNVLRGDMSLVGPRPEDPRWVNLRSADQRLLQRVRPGITSPASLAFRDEERLLQGPDWVATYRDVVQPRKAALDAAYVRCSGVRPALGVLARTALALLLPHPPPSPRAALPERG